MTMIMVAIIMKILIHTMQILYLVQEAVGSFSQDKGGISRGQTLTLGFNRIIIPVINDLFSTMGPDLFISDQGFLNLPDIKGGRAIKPKKGVGGPQITPIIDSPISLVVGEGGSPPPPSVITTPNTNMGPSGGLILQPNLLECPLMFAFFVRTPSIVIMTLHVSILVGLNYNDLSAGTV